MTAILALGIAGNVMEPQWEPQQYDVPAEFTAIPELDVAADEGGTAPVVHDDVAVTVQGETLEGYVYSPAPDSGSAAGQADTARYPAVLFLHGAGTKDRTGFAEQAEHLASSGIVALVLDRRTKGYSTWHRDYELMAEDALAGVDLLRDRPEVDPERVGLFGESEGSWVAPVAAVNDPRIAFMVLVSAPIVSPAQQATYATLMALERLDAPDPVDRAVAKGIGLAMTVPNLLEYRSFDVVPYLERTDQPILMAFGTEDAAVPIVQAADMVAAANDNLMVRYFEGAQHAIRLGDEFGPFADGYLDLLSTWILDAADGSVAGPAIAGGEPVQTLSASAVPPPPWFATANAHIAALLLAVAGYAAGPVVGRFLKRRRSEGGTVGPALRRRLRWLRLAGAGSLASLVLYFWGLSHLALNHETSRTITYGLWIGVWIITGVAVTALANLWLDNSWRVGKLATEVGDYPVAKLNRIEVIALSGAAAGTVLLLMLVTYWGVFLGI
jgi:pimeloyl-ACP methyl ester carboxylesterase